VDTAFPTLPLTTAAISIELLMDTTNTLQTLETLITCRADAAVHHPEKGPALRHLLAELLELVEARTEETVR
jgi:hypothetical protein